MSDVSEIEIYDGKMNAAAETATSAFEQSTIKSNSNESHATYIVYYTELIDYIVKCSGDWQILHAAKEWPERRPVWGVADVEERVSDALPQYACTRIALHSGDVVAKRKNIL